jgi:hypothetical protein
MEFFVPNFAASSPEPDYVTLFNPVARGDYVAGNVYASRGTAEPDIMEAVTLLERATDQGNQVVLANAFFRGL